MSKLMQTYPHLRSVLTAKLSISARQTSKQFTDPEFLRLGQAT